MQGQPRPWWHKWFAESCINEMVLSHYKYNKCAQKSKNTYPFCCMVFYLVTLDPFTWHSRTLVTHFLRKQILSCIGHLYQQISETLLSIKLQPGNINNLHFWQFSFEICELTGSNCDLPGKLVHLKLKWLLKLQTFKILLSFAYKQL